MKYLSLFTGIGGFELGINRAYEILNLGRTTITPDSENGRYQPLPNDSNGNGRRTDSSIPECIGYSEIDRYATQVYSKQFPNHINYGDITKINATELPDFDFLCGGFPCQSFSIAGKRKGFEDTRGTLFYDICRIAKAKEPVLMLLENVKGLVSHDGGKTLEIILDNLQELGYYTNYEIRNSKDYGVPQNRERIFLLCKHIKLLSSIGQNEKMTLSENIIQEWLFQILLNNLNEAKKVQGTESKDWVLGYLLCLEISQNQSLSGENILDGIMIPTAGKSSLFKGDPWQNIATWLSKNLDGNLQELNTSTISIAIKEIIESKIYTFSKMFQAILLATVLLKQSSNNLWSEVLSSLILIPENTKYARINNKNEKAIITENGTAHLSNELQDPAKYFIVGHLRGSARPQVFPIGESNTSNIAQLNKPRHSNNRIYETRGVSPTLNTAQGGNRQPKIGIDTAGLQTIATSIDANYHKGNGHRGTSRGRTLVLQDMKIRRLTPMECERLQGFPDSWTEGVSDTQRYKVLGNAVTTCVIKEIVLRLLYNS